MKTAAIILALDEKNHIKECIRHHKPHVDHLLVVDGGSTDGTQEIANILADEVIVRPKIKSFAEERNYAWKQVPEDTEWTLFIDADERFHELLLPNLDTIIEGVIEQSPETIAFRFPRANLPKCSDYPDYHTRLLKNNSGITWVNKVDEVPVIEGEQVDSLPGKCMTVLDKPIWHFMEKRQRWYREGRTT